MTDTLWVALCDDHGYLANQLSRWSHDDVDVLTKCGQETK
jgi:hypothetical protein